MLDGGAVPEGRVDEQVGPALDLPLGERPELDDLHATRQRVRKAPQGEDPGGPGQEKAPWARIQVDQDLDRPQQLRRELDLVDDHEPVVLDEPCRVVLRGPQCGSVIEEAHDGARADYRPPIS